MKKVFKWAAGIGAGILVLDFLAAAIIIMVWKYYG